MTTTPNPSPGAVAARQPVGDRTTLAWPERWIRVGLLALPVYGVMLFAGTLTHQPDYATDFQSYAEYVTTTRFIVDHLVFSILATAVGMVGIAAVAAALARTAVATTAVLGATLSVVGLSFIQAVIGAAAFAQPAIGRAYLAGQKAAAVAVNADVYGPRLVVVALTGVALYLAGGILLGLALWRAQTVPRWAGVLYGASVALFAFVGLVIGPVQTVGATLLIVSGSWIARSLWRATTEASR